MLGGNKGRSLPKALFVIEQMGGWVYLSIIDVCVVCSGTQ